MQDWVYWWAMTGLILAPAFFIIASEKETRSIPKVSSAKKKIVLFSKDKDDFPKCWAEFVRNMEGHMSYGQLQILQPLPQEFSQFDNPPEILPAIRLYPNGLEGNYVDFQGRITLDNLINFVQANYDPNHVPIQQTKIIAPRQ